MKFLRIAIFVFLLLFLTAYAFITPFRVRVLIALGRSPMCSQEKALSVEGDWNLLFNRGNEIVALSKIVDVDPAGFHQWETPQGRFWIPATDDKSFPLNLSEQDLGIYTPASHEVEPGDVVLDCGANVGVFTRAALKAGAKTVVAIEPGREALDCLHRNFAKEVMEGRVIIYPKGVWDKEDSLPFYESSGDSAAHTVMPDANAVAAGKIALTTIERIVAELKLDRVDFIKMDIEGSEPEALKGAIETIRSFKPRLSVCTYHAANHPFIIPELIRAVRLDYEAICGPCQETGVAISPRILYFH